MIKQFIGLEQKSQEIHRQVRPDGQVYQQEDDENNLLGWNKNTNRFVEDIAFIANSSSEAVPLR